MSNLTRTKKRDSKKGLINVTSISKLEKSHTTKIRSNLAPRTSPAWKILEKQYANTKKPSRYMIFWTMPIHGHERRGGRSFMARNLRNLQIMRRKWYAEQAYQRSEKKGITPKTTRSLQQMRQKYRE